MLLLLNNSQNCEQQIQPVLDKLLDQLIVIALLMTYVS